MHDMIIVQARTIKPIHIRGTKPAFAVLSTDSFLCSADAQQNLHLYWFIRYPSIRQIMEQQAAAESSSKSGRSL